MGIAQRSNALLVISPDHIKKNPHSTRSTEHEMRLIASMFPYVDIGVASDKLNCIHEPAGGAIGYFNYSIEQNTLLKGYFQNEKYFPSDDSWMPVMQCRECPTRTMVQTSRCAFVHVRRGDYVNNPKHNVDLHQYYQITLQRLGEMQSRGDIDTIIVFSDEPQAARKMVRAMAKFNFTVAPSDMQDHETLWLMSRCVAGVCANSSFSRFAAYMSYTRQEKSGTFYLPKKWFNTNFNHIDHLPHDVTWAFVV